MDDLEFRRRVLADPRQRDEDIRQAADRSEANNKFLDDVLDLDAQIKQAMTIDVPEDLADKILFSQTSTNDSVDKPSPSFFNRAMGLAASVAFVGGLLMGQINWGNVLIAPAEASLASTAIQHVIEEEPFVRHLNEHVNAQQINAKLAPFHFALTERFPYHVYYLNHCGFGDSNALHLVFQGTQGKVTLFITHANSDQTIAFAEDGFDGVIKPMAESSLILVGEKGEDLMPIAQKLQSILVAHQG